MIDWLSLFQNFGYPALISGVLLYIVVYKLERVASEIEESKLELTKLNAALTEYRNDVRDMMVVVDRRFIGGERRREQ